MRGNKPETALICGSGLSVVAELFIYRTLETCCFSEPGLILARKQQLSFLQKCQCLFVVTSSEGKLAEKVITVWLKRRNGDRPFKLLPRAIKVSLGERLFACLNVAQRDLLLGRQ